MLHISEVKGAIFDVDDTLLDNNTTPDPTNGLHARSRLLAVQTVGAKHDISSLRDLTPQANVEAFRSATHHTLASAVWNILYLNNVVNSDEIDDSNSLLQEIVTLKTKNHEMVLRTEGKEVPGAGDFVRALAVAGLGNKLAIASAAVRSEILIFLGIASLESYFPENRIVSLENVTRFKPDPQCFDMAFQTLDLPDSDRASVLAFEDDPRGIKSAKSAGLYVCAITTRFTAVSGELQRAGADFVGDSYTDFADALHLPFGI